MIRGREFICPECVSTQTRDKRLQAAAISWRLVRAIPHLAGLMKSNMSFLYNKFRSKIAVLINNTNNWGPFICWTCHNVCIRVTNIYFFVVVCCSKNRARLRKLKSLSKVFRCLWASIMQYFTAKHFFQHSRPLCAATV